MLLKINNLNIKAILQRFTALMIISLSFSSCIEDVTLDLPPYQPKLAVYCILEPDSLPVLYLNESVSTFAYGDTSTSPTSSMRFINDALVVISDENNDRDTLKLRMLRDSFQSFNTYFYEGKRRIEAGRKYYLYISQGGRQVSSEAKVPHKPEIGNIELNRLEDAREFTITVNVKDVGGEENYYQIIASSVFDPFRSSGVELDNDPFRYQSDKGFDGKEVPLIIPGRFRRSGGDTATVTGTVIRATKATGEYLYTLGLQSDVGDNPFSEPVIIQHNITGGLGLFGAKSTPVPFEFKIR